MEKILNINGLEKKLMIILKKYIYTLKLRTVTKTDITSKIKIYNTVFFNINNNQVNIVLIEYKNKKINLNFTKDSEVQIFKLN